MSTSLAVPRPLIRYQAGIGAVLLFLLAIVLWTVFSQLTFVIPAPGETTAVLIDNLGDPGYLENVRATAIAVLWAFGLGTLLGGSVGLVLGLSPLLRNMFEPMVVGLNGIPKIVLYPVMLPIFSLGGSKIVMGILFSLFPVLINVAAGVRDIPTVYWKLAKSLNARKGQTFVHIVLPAIRAPMLTGIRLATSLATVGVVLSEFFATRHGLGRVVLQAYGMGDYPTMIATVLLLLAVSFLVSLLLWRLEKRLR